jgi:hypothetical protein
MFAPRTPTPAYARTSAILVDEFDPSRFKSTFDYLLRCPTRLVHPSLQLADGHNANTGTICKSLLIPIKKPARRPALSRVDHAETLQKPLIPSNLSKID